MEVPLLDGGMSWLQSPNRLLSISELRYLWTWAALLLASLAAFTSLIRRARLVILKPHRGKSVISHPQPDFSTDDDDDDDDDDEAASSADDDDEDEIASSSEEEDELAVGALWNYAEDQGQNSKSPDAFFTPELFDGGVVKAWDGLGRGFGCPADVVSLLDGLRDFPVRSGQISLALVECPSVVVSAATARGGGEVAVRAWDARAGGRAPAAAAEWRARGVAAIAYGGDGRRVYVSDDVGAVAELDLRNARVPVWDTWWGADTAMVGNGGKAERDASVKSWCWNVVKNFPIIPLPQ